MYVVHVLYLQVTNPRLVCDFFAMAGSKEWRADAKPIAHLCIPLCGRDLTLQKFQATSKSVLEAMRKYPSHEACSSIMPCASELDAFMLMK